MTQVEGGSQELQGLTEAYRRFGFEQRTELGGRFVHRVPAKRPGHALVRAKGINGERKRGGLAVYGGLLEKKRLAATRFFHFPIGQLGNLKFRGDWLGNAAEFPRAFQSLEKLAEGIERHRAATLAEVRKRAKVSKGKIRRETVVLMRDSHAKRVKFFQFRVEGVWNALVLWVKVGWHRKC
jgi:hypothetical protein